MSNTVLVLPIHLFENHKLINKDSHVFIYEPFECSFLTFKRPIIIK